MATKLKPAIFTPNDQTAPRVCPELACEIGLNESMVLLQLEFWIRLSGKKQKDGRFWIYESLTDFHEIFSFWSPATINRIVHSLQEKKLIHVGNFNKLKFDRTRWFALNGEEIKKLESVRIVTGWAFADDSSISQNDTRTTQNDISSAQNDTTIPDLSSDLSTDFSSTPSSGEKPEPKNVPDLADELFGHVQESEPPKPEGPTYLERLREAAGGDPVAGAAFIAQTATDAPMSVPAEAGGQDDWIRVAEAFCCLQGLALSDMPPKAQKQWPRKLQSIAEGAGASPAQTIEAIRVMPNTDMAFKITSCYTTPFSRSFSDDIQMVIAKIATGQDITKGNGHGNGNGYHAEPITPGRDSIETIQRAMAKSLGDRLVGGLG